MIESVTRSRIRFKRMAMGGFHLVLAILCIMGSARVLAQNLVTNGGFENGFSGWSNNTSGVAVASYSLETSLPYAGAQAMKIAISNPGAQVHNVQTLGPTFALAVGTSTTITFRARATTAGAKVRFVMQNNTYNQREFTLSTSWQWFIWNHTTTETSPRLRIQYRSAATIWLDEISVVANAAAGTTTRISSDPTIRHQMMDGIGGSIAFNTPDYQALSTTKKNEIEKNSITTFVINLTDTLNPYDPELLFVNSFEHQGNQVSLAIPDQPGHDFILWKSTTLAPGSWQEVTNAVRIESNGELILTDPTPSPNQSFYIVQRSTGL